MIMSPAITRDQTSAWKRYFEGRVVISSASGTEGGEVFYGLTDWLGSRDPLIPYDTHVAHRFGLAD
jgi:Ni,Fe-hydrogenase III small subunit